MVVEMRPDLNDLKKPETQSFSPNTPHMLHVWNVYIYHKTAPRYTFHTIR